MVELYVLYLNGNVYGKGTREYVCELITDYISTSRMYGNPSCEFEVRKVGAI